VIEYQYQGLPHAHLVVCLDNAHDIDDPNCEDLINFINRHFVAEMPRFEGEEHQNVYMQDVFTDEYKHKAVEVVHMNNTHKCATSINGCKQDDDDTCKRGFSRTETISETYVNEVTKRIVYQRRMECDLKIVPYNLQMIMDWKSHLNVEYSGSTYCALYIYKYWYKGAARKERIDLGLEKEQDSLDEINCSFMAELCVLWQQFGECMDIRIIPHQNHLYVHLKYAVELN
jgi:hypothetical protein